VYATGLGAVDPPLADGSVTGFPLSQHVATFKATVDGQEANVLYAGSVPRLLAGVSQLNIEIPVTARSEAVQLKIWDAAGPQYNGAPAVTVFVQ